MRTRVLVLGGAGMLGHKLWQVFRTRFSTWVTVRATYERYARYELFDAARTLAGVEVRVFETVAQAVRVARPDVVVNAVGLVKQLPAASDPALAIEVNALFPHRLATLCRAAGVRLIHLSTDCVFSGRAGMYTENDRPDPDDLYGRSKLLGEVDGPGCLVLRTSMIGRELETTHGLVEWFLSHRGGRVRGYTRAMFSGLPTIVLAHLLADVVDSHPALEGLYHIAAAPISKYDLLRLLHDAYGAPIEITPDPGVRVGRSLDATRFRSATGYEPPPWPEMIRRMAVDATPYGRWERARVF